jgi:hypothetical protein
MNTGDLGAASQPGGSLYNIEVSNDGLITFPSGIPLKLNGDRRSNRREWKQRRKRSHHRRGRG